MTCNEVDHATIGRIFGKKESTIKGWLGDWHKRRLTSIFTGHKGNTNANKLTPQQKQEIQQALQSPPSDYGLPKVFWDLPELKHYVSAAFGVQYELDTSYHYLLKFSNLSFKYADIFDRKRDVSAINERMAAIGVEVGPTTRQQGL